MQKLQTVIFIAKESCLFPNSDFNIAPPVDKLEMQFIIFSGAAFVPQIRADP